MKETVKILDIIKGYDLKSKGVSTITDNNRILTQAFVSRKHMEIFGWYFPEEIKNWCCDDWYNMVYHPNYLYPLRNHFAVNMGGAPRYDINNDPNFTGKNNSMLGQQIFSHNVMKLRIETQELANKHKKLKYFVRNIIKKFMFIALSILQKKDKTLNKLISINDKLIFSVSPPKLPSSFRVLIDCEFFEVKLDSGWYT